MINAEYHEKYLERIDELMSMELTAEELTELDKIVDLVVEYEDRHYPMGTVSPAVMRRFSREQGHG